MSIGEPNARKTPAVMVVQNSLASLRIKQIRACGCEMLSVKVVPNYIKSYQGRDLRQVLLIVRESLENVHTTRLELICSSEEAVLDQSECNTDIRKRVSKQHRGPEMFDGLL